MGKKSIVRFVAVITTITSIFTNSYSIEDLFLLLVSTGCLLYIIDKYTITSHIGKYMVLIGFWMSIIFIPSFHLGMVMGLDSGASEQNSYNIVAAFGAKVLFATCIAWLIICPKAEVKAYNISYSPKLIRNNIVHIFFGIIFTTSVFCYSIGLGRMGADAVVLPFHLGGIINLARKILYPALFAVIVENHILCGKKVPRSYFLLFFLWSTIEMITWLSKSILVMNFVPVFFVLWIYLRPSIKNIAKIGIPIFAIFFMLYPLISAMRNADRGKSFSEYVMNAINLADEENEDVGSKSPLLAPLNRTFMTYSQYTKDNTYIDKNSIFDFSKTPALLALGGAASYQTFVIEGYPPGVSHSSGTTGLMDPLLHGGYGLCYIVIFILILFANFVDGQIPKRKYSIIVQLLFMIYSFSLIKNISGFYDGTGISTLFVQTVAIILANRINFRYTYNK